MGEKHPYNNRTVPVADLTASKLNTSLCQVNGRDPLGHNRLNSHSHHQHPHSIGMQRNVIRTHACDVRSSLSIDPIKKAVAEAHKANPPANNVCAANMPISHSSIHASSFFDAAKFAAK